MAPKKPKLPPASEEAKPKAPAAKKIRIKPAKIPAVEKPKLPPASFRIAGILAHAEASREAGERLALPDNLRDLSDLDLSGANISGADLRNANLTGANLTGAILNLTDLRGASLDRADLRGAALYGASLAAAKINYADLRGATLSQTFLNYAKLWHTDLSGADLRKADLTGADLTRASLTRASLTRADLTGANLTGANLYDANLTSADLSDANLNGADLTSANLINANLRDADLTGANLSGANLSGANLQRANLQRAILTGADLSGADLTNADLTSAGLSGAILQDANLTNADLTGADLTGANLTDADLTGVDLSKVKGLPRTGALKEQYKIEAPSSSEFERWFWQSVVVGDNKKPIVVYHGTNKGGFTAFDPKKRDAHHNAFYFTDDAEVAETYTDEHLPQERPDPALTNDTVGIYRLYIRLVNPMVIEGGGKYWDNLSDPRAPGLRKTYQLATWAQKNGHDGVIFKDIVDGGGQGAQEANPATVYAVFDPRAIKSATANNGKYDPCDPDIRHNPVIEPSSVATLVFDRQGRVLILRRGPTAPWMPGKWSLPGGTVDPGETLLQAAVREAVEETTLEVKRAHPLTVIEHKPGGWSAAFFVSYPGDWSGKVKLDYENDAFAWIAESDIPRYSFIPTVIRALRLGFKGLRK